MSVVPILLSMATFFSTLFGGVVAFKYRDKPHLILGFTAGVLMGVVSFDVLPEIIRLVQQLQVPPLEPMVALVVAFLLFHVTEKLLLIHTANEEHYHDHHHPDVGFLSAAALIGHSFIDGVGIGLGFQVSPAVGLVVAIAVISHDFSDGLNTVTLLLTNHNTTRQSRLMLFLDASAPVVGAISTLFFHIPQYVLLLYLGAFAGFLLYIGASEILPQAHTGKSSVWTILLTVFGAVFAYTVVVLAG